MARSLAILALVLLSGCAAPAVVSSGDFDVELAAARSGFERAHLLLHETMAGLHLTSVDAWVWAGKKLQPEQAERVVRVARRGVGHAENAVRLRPEAAEAHLYLALNLTLAALDKSKAGALLQGIPGRIRAAYERALELDRTCGHGAALRLKGRFLTLAPWPYRDRAEAARALEEALALTEDPQTLLYRGDLCHLEGRGEEARQAWRLARAASGTGALDGFVRALAQRRLDLSG